MIKEKKKVITGSQYLQLLGLFTIAVKLAKQIDEAQEAFADILKLKGDDSYDRGGWIMSDNIWDGDVSGFEKLLKCHVIVKK